MADEDKNELGADGEAAEGSPKGKGKLVKIGGGVGLLLVLAFVAATMAVPGKVEHPRFGTPFTVPMVLDKDAKIPVNLDENNKTRFLQMNFNFLVRAYKNSYVAKRQLDPNYEPFLRSRLIAVATSKKLDEVLGGPAERERFLEEVREQLDPILFPVHIGNTTDPLAADETSGLMPGSMMSRASYRGHFHDNVLKLDVPGHTVTLKGGTPVEFTGEEVNLVVRTAAGEVLYLDMTNLRAGYVGELPIGVHGRINQVLAVELLAQ